MSEGKSPPSDSGSNSKKETLTQRYRRFLGTPLPEKEDDVKPGKRHKEPTRRREQILKAQRSHRQRTQRYLESLEQEVVRLREQESRLKARNKILENLLTYNGIAIPGDALATQDSVEGTQEHDERVQEAIQQHSGPSVLIDLSVWTKTEPDHNCSTTAATDIPPTMKSQAQPQTTQGNNVPVLLHLDQPDSAGLDAQIAIDFILLMERGCLAHVKESVVNRNHPRRTDTPLFNSGRSHAFTATSSLICQHVEDFNTMPPFQVPEVDIERLLEASERLHLANEITPVQIWNHIRQAATRQVITRQTVLRLLETLLRYCYCNSFGSVVEIQTANKIFAAFNLPPASILINPDEVLDTGVMIGDLTAEERVQYF